MFCNVTWFFGYHAGQVLGCLKEVKAQISKRCKTEVYKIMMDVSLCARGLTAPAQMFCSYATPSCTSTR